MRLSTTEVVHNNDRLEDTFWVQKYRMTVVRRSLVLSNHSTFGTATIGGEDCKCYTYCVRTEHNRPICGRNPITRSMC